MPAIPVTVKRCTALTGGAVSFRQSAGGVALDLSKAARDGVDVLVAMELAGPAAKIPPTRLYKAYVSTDMPAKASNVFMNAAAFDASKAVDEDAGTRWATDGGVTSAWLEVDLKQPTAFDSISISEAFDRVQEFEVQCRDTESQDWVTVHRGTTIGANLPLKLQPTKARYVRLNITKSTDGPTIYEFGVSNSTARSGAEGRAEPPQPPT